ncbi:hypothetical protein SBA_ch1_09650 [Sphingomonas bisphenolicum]|uniref:Uncharacterized protein n=1 Tax=Sphingomonas bisphenolicum TaxID=296544 RepID=A0ABM7G1B6_9SPHN|nr:hypothetical protein SBA_ch1_09650 [Sphingomonas bisphenolicum]
MGFETIQFLGKCGISVGGACWRDKWAELVGWIVKGSRIPDGKLTGELEPIERTGVIVRAAMSRLISSDAKRMEQVTDFAGQAAFKLQTPKYIGKIVTGENLKTIPRGS